MTNAVTVASAYVRFTLIKLQIRTLLRNAAGASTVSIDKVSKGLDDPHYIEQVAVRGFFDDGDVGVEVRLVIDWREYKLNTIAGGDSVMVPKTWRNGISPNVEEAIYTFIEICNHAKLKIEWYVVYCNHFNEKEVDSILGFCDAKVRKWRTSPECVELGLGPLSEGRVIVSIAGGI